MCHEHNCQHGLTPHATRPGSKCALAGPHAENKKTGTFAAGERDLFPKIKTIWGIYLTSVHTICRLLGDGGLPHNNHGI
jgi:hypothetical protein